MDRILSDELVRAMIAVPSQPDFESYCSILKEADDRLRAYKARTTKRNEPKTLQPAWKQSTDVDQSVTSSKVPNGREVTRKASVESMEWEPTPAKVATTSARRAKWVSQEERDRRRQARLCIRCRGSGHMIRECPYGPPQRPITSNSVRKEKAKAKEVEPELEDEEPQSSESEN